MNDFFRSNTTDNTIFQRFNNAAAFHDRFDFNTFDIMVADFDFACVIIQNHINQIFRDLNASRN